MQRTANMIILLFVVRGAEERGEKEKLQWFVPLSGACAVEERMAKPLHSQKKMIGEQSSSDRGRARRPGARFGRPSGHDGRVGGIPCSAMESGASMGAPKLITLRLRGRRARLRPAPRTKFRQAERRPAKPPVSIGKRGCFGFLHVPRRRDVRLRHMAAHMSVLGTWQHKHSDANLAKAISTSQGSV